MRIAQDVKAHGGPWFAALRRLAATATDPLFVRAQRLLPHWQELARRLPAHDLLDRICNEGDVAGRYEAMLPPAERARVRGNLGALLQLALEADSGRYPSLPRFLEWLDAQQRAFHNAPDEPPPAAATGQVRIMTIHAAKGLEAPAVFLYNAGSSLIPRTPRLLIEWPEHEPRPTHFMVAGAAARLDALGRTLADAHKAREAREELHVLYVAATRARHFLHVSGFVSQNKKSWHGHALKAMETLASAPPLPGTAVGSLCYATGTAPHARPAPAAAPARAVDARLRQPLAAPAPEAPPSARAEAGAFETPEAADRGTAIHLLLQRLSQGPGDDTALWAEVRARLESEPSREDFQRWLTDARAVLSDPGLARFFRADRYARAWNEVPVSLEGATGVIDRLVDDGQELWVVDYKTHTRPDPVQLAARYRAQLAAYADAVREIWPGRPVRGGLILTATRAFVPVL